MFSAALRPTLFITAAFLLATGGASAQKGDIQKPRDKWQKPGEIQQPRGTWQKPGEIQIPKGIQAIRKEEAPCEHRLVVLADALFEFDKASLSKDAAETLKTLGPMLKERAATHPVRIEGHTDSVGSEEYNQKLSENRAQAVRDWLVEQGYLTRESSSIKGLGETRPAAPNTKPDGSDDPAGRQKNRRVEIIIVTCKS